MFYIFDPSFYNIMKALSTSIEISFPYTFVEVTQVYAVVDIQLNRSLEQMPCRDDVVDALKMVLVWVRSYLQ